MREGECRQTRRGVTYCYIPRLGVRFCPKGTRDVSDCRVRISGDMRRGRWERRRIGLGLRGRVPTIEV